MAPAATDAGANPALDFLNLPKRNQATVLVETKISINKESSRTDVPASVFLMHTLSPSAASPFFSSYSLLSSQLVQSHLSIGGWNVFMGSLFFK